MNNQKYGKILRILGEIHDKLDHLRLDLEVEPILNQHQDRVRLIIGGWLPELAILIGIGRRDFNEETLADKEKKGAPEND